MPTGLNYLHEYSYKIAKEKSEWIDKSILQAIPKWKADLIIKYKSKLLARIVGVNVEILNKTLVLGFGTEVAIKLNGKIIAERKFKY